MGLYIRLALVHGRAIPNWLGFLNESLGHGKIKFMMAKW
jgi:hypothetical protein